MFLAIKEMKKYKLRYSLVIGVIMLISYLVFVLTGLANGLASSNRLAIDSWNASQIVLNRDADGSLTQSNLTEQQQNSVKKSGKYAEISQASANMQNLHQNNRVGVQILGIDKQQFIAHQYQIIKGHQFRNDRQIVVDQNVIQQNHYRLGQTVRFSKTSPKYKIVGITKNQELNVAPVVYTSLNGARDLKFGAQNKAISAIVFKSGHHKINNSDLQIMSINDFIQDLPGYSAQNSTFEFMIVFLLIITMFIIAIFLYILTIQKSKFFAVMKIQGISDWTLIRSIIAQSLLLTIIGLIISGILTFLTALSIPNAVPIVFDPMLISGVIVIMIIMAVIGSIVPVRTITKIDPATVMGG